MGLLLLVVGFIVFWICGWFIGVEGFSSNTKDETTAIYNMDIIGRDVGWNHYRQTGIWPWSDNIRKIYMDTISRSAYVSVDPANSANFAQTIYPESSVKRVLAMDDSTREGRFLMGGVSNQDGAILKCIGGSMTKVELDENYQKKARVIADADIPGETPGFSFMKGVCNPCNAIDGDYSCPFSFSSVKKRENDEYVGNRIKDGETSPIWKYLWGMPIDYDALRVPDYTRITNTT